MIKSAIASLSLLLLSVSVFAGTPQDDSVVRLGDDTAAALGGPLSAPALAMIGAVGLIAGIRYLRNKRS